MPSADIFPDGRIKISDANEAQLINIIRGVQGQNNKGQPSNKPPIVNTEKAHKDIVERFQQPSVLKGLLLDLIKEGYFDSYRNRADICKTLEQRGYTPNRTLVSTYTSRLVERKILESKSTGKGNQLEYRKYQGKPVQSPPQKPNAESESQLKLQ